MKIETAPKRWRIFNVIAIYAVIVNMLWILPISATITILVLFPSSFIAALLLTKILDPPRKL